LLRGKVIFKPKFSEKMHQQLQLAILDMYDGTPNQGMRCIQDILKGFSDTISYKIFDVRQKNEIPNFLDFDIFISTGGPGDPREGDGIWDKNWYHWLDEVHRYNKNIAEEGAKKYVFFICHSFQMACAHFKIGEITPRQSMSFGTFPVYKTEEGEQEEIFEALENPFYIADFRRFQVVSPDYKQLDSLDATILALEKPRPHVPLERALMAARFSKEMIGTQFHPEADGDGMLVWFQQEDKKNQVVAEHGQEKYDSMIFDLSDPNKIEFTQNTILPTFLRTAIGHLQMELDFA
jgi:homoserine O-succinyltransferase/O-acetyltransferase